MRGNELERNEEARGTEEATGSRENSCGTREFICIYMYTYVYTYKICECIDTLRTQASNQLESKMSVESREPTKIPTSLLELDSRRWCYLLRPSYKKQCRFGIMKRRDAFRKHHFSKNRTRFVARIEEAID